LRSNPGLTPAIRKAKGQPEDWPKCLFLFALLARPERFERPTPWFVAKPSALSPTITSMHKEV
ncbi:MAG: hypothetical protein Q8Q81_08050, partial [Oxalobacteraceae bacterium]|nr:hypothetical protein [Oxalobacteraceae bacterium]